MEEHNIERLFKAQKAHESMDPPTFVWDNLEQDLKKQSKRRKPLYFWLIGLVIGVGMVSFLFLQSRDNEQHEPTSNSSMTADIGDQDTKLLTSGQHVTIQVPLHTSDTELGSTTLQSAATEQIDNEKNNTSISQVTTGSNRVDGTISSTPSLSAVTTSQAAQWNTATNTTPSAASFEALPKSNGLQIAQVPGHMNLNKSTTETHTQRKLFLKARTKEQLLMVGTMLIPLQQANRSIESPSFSNLITTINTSQRRNLIGGYVSIGKPIFDSRAAHDFKTDSSTDWYSYGAGMMYERVLTSRISIGTGFSYTVSKRKFNYESTDLLLVRTSSGTLAYERLLSKGEQNYSFANIPLSIKYQLLTSKVRLAIGFSGILNVGLTTSGKSLDVNGQVQRYSSADNQYQTSFGLGYSPFLSIDFPVGEHTSLSLRPHFIGYFNPLIQSNSNVLIDYSSFGINMGINRRF